MDSEHQLIRNSSSGEIPQANPVERCVQLSLEGRNLDAFTNWFQIPSTERTSLIYATLRGLSTSHTDFYDALIDHNISPQDSFILRNLALISSDTGEKIFTPSDTTEISLDELENPIYTAKRGRNVRKEDPNEVIQSPSFHRKLIGLMSDAGVNWRGDHHDFSEAKDIIHSTLTDDEVSSLYKRIIPHLKDVDFSNEMDQINLAAPLHPIKHLNIAVDPGIGEYFEFWAIKNIISPHDYEIRLANFISQFYFPSSGYFEKFFAEKKDFTDKDYIFEVVEGSLPAHALYFTVLRQLVHLDRYVASYGLSPQDAGKIQERITGYLFSDQFMERALPYLETEEEYPDDIINMTMRGSIEHQLKIVNQGNEAKQEKKQRFEEILHEAEKYLRGKGDDETADKLRVREVDGIKFADFYQTS